MKDYESRPLDATIKRWKLARKNHLKWLDGAKGSTGYGKNILGVVMTMDRLYSTKNTLYI